MKKAIALVSAAVMTAGNLFATGFESRRFTPYFNMTMGEGAYLPNHGAFFTGAQMNMQMGLLSKAAEKHEFFALYNLGFDGQGFRFPDTQEFDSKSMSHLFSLEYRWTINDHWRIRPSVSAGKTYTQTAASEIWGKGLYDDKPFGTQLAADYGFQLLGKKAVVTGTLARYIIKFPNYTDILRQFQGESSNTELAGGLKDQRLTEYALAYNRTLWHVRLRLNHVDYKREHVVQSNATYGGAKQKDSNAILNASYDGKLWRFECTPQGTFQIHKSNQNFLLFQSATDPSPVFASNYYDYKQVGLALPLYLNLSEKWALSGGLDWQRRKYDSRQPRNESNQFKGGKQTNSMVTLSGGLRKRLTDVSSLFLTYSVTTARSNNKFERYLPYNYTGQGLSVGYQLTY
jgi:hypothetical protein